MRSTYKFRKVSNRAVVFKDALRDDKAARELCTLLAPFAVHGVQDFLKVLHVVVAIEAHRGPTVLDAPADGETYTCIGDYYVALLAERGDN